LGFPCAGQKYHAQCQYLALGQVNAVEAIPKVELDDEDQTVGWVDLDYVL